MQGEIYPLNWVLRIVKGMSEKSRNDGEFKLLGIKKRTHNTVVSENWESAENKPNLSSSQYEVLHNSYKFLVCVKLPPSLFPSYASPIHEAKTLKLWGRYALNHDWIIHTIFWVWSWITEQIELRNSIIK